MEEPPEILARRGRNLRKGAAIVAGIAAGFLALGVVIGWGPTWAGFARVFVLTGLIVGPIFMILAFVLLRASQRLKPIRFYENGIEVHPLAGHRVVFVSYGEVLSIDETRIPLEGDVYRLRVVTPGVMIGIPRDMTGAVSIVDRIRARMGRPEFVVRVSAPPSPATQRFAAWFPIIALAIAGGGSILLVSTMPAGLGPADTGLLFGLFFAPLGMIAVTYATFRLRSMKQFIGPSPSVKLPALIVAGLLAYGAVNLSLASTAPDVTPPVPDITPRPSASALTPGIYENTTLTLPGIVRVDPGEDLTLRNVNLTLETLAGVPGGVWVAAGGQLTLENVTVRGAGASITFEILGSARILRSDIANLAGDPAKDHTDGGLEIYSSDVLIEGTTVHDTATNGIFIVDASPIIRNSSVVGAGDDCIELQRSNATIEDSTVMGCGWAMIVWLESAPTIRGTRFADNEHGLHFTESGGRIENNTFDGNDAYAIRLVDGSNPLLTGNAFLTSTDDVERVSTFDFTFLCGPPLVGIGLACLGGLYLLHRRDRRSTSRPSLET